MGAARWAVLWAFSASLIAGSSLTGCATTPSSRPTDHVLAEFPIRDWDGLILIPVRYGGKRSYFLLDTGSSYDVLNTADFPNLKPVDKPVRASTPGGDETLQLCEPPDLKVGPCSIAASGPCARCDLSEVSGAMGHPLAGVLGLPAMKAFVIQIDYDKHRVRFLQPGNQPHGEWGEVFAMQTIGLPFPEVRVRVDGAEQALGIDTGSDGCLDLPREAFDHLLDRVVGEPVISLPTITDTGDIWLRAVRVPNTEIAGRDYSDLIYSETLASVDSLGLDFLERHLVTLDFPNNRLYLKPGKELRHRSEGDMSGLYVRRESGELIAKFVYTGSPAYQAGIREGDVLVALNGKSAKAYDIGAIYGLLSAGDGRNLTITFRHGKIQRTVSFKLHRMI